MIATLFFIFSALDNRFRLWEGCMAIAIFLAFLGGILAFYSVFFFPFLTILVRSATEEDRKQRNTGHSGRKKFQNFLGNIPLLNIV